MIFVLLPILIILALLLYRNLYKQAKALNKAKEFVNKSIFYGFLLLLGILILSGKLHWLGGAFAVALLVLKKAVALIIRFWPIVFGLINSRYKAKSSKNSTSANRQMTADKALKILNLEGNPDKSQIIKAHRTMLSKVHPDKGGSDYLAAEINLAKEVLLKRIKN